MPAVKRSSSDIDSLQSFTPPSSPTGPKTPTSNQGSKPDSPSSDDEYSPTPKHEKGTSAKSRLQTPVPSKTPKTKKTKMIGQGDGEAGGHGNFTPEKKEGVIEDLLAAGLKVVSVEELATKYGLSKLQLRNALQAGRGNLRKKVVQAARLC